MRQRRRGSGGIARLEDLSRYDETYYRPAVNERGNPPFPIDIDQIFGNRIVYAAYGKIMLAHRNQASQYGAILDRARQLHALVYRRLHGVDEPGNCQLQRMPGGDGYVGGCGVLFSGGNPAGSSPQQGAHLSLQPVDAINSGQWRMDETPATVWAGKLRATSHDDDRIELETSLIGNGVLRTQSGWFPVSALEVSQDKARVSFRVDTKAEVGANAMDVDILKHAKALLTDAAHWDRQDNRQCDVGKPSLSLYCALIQAMRMQSGGVHHRRPALQLVRGLVDARSVGRDYQHRLRDYNNDPRTTLADVQGVLDEATNLALTASRKDADGVQ